MSLSQKIYDFDKRGVRFFVKHQPYNGKYSIECWRKKTDDESEGEHDWNMIRIGHIESYSTREQAEKEVIRMADEICNEYGF